MTIIEFLLARFAEDEAVARAASEKEGARWYDESGIVSRDELPGDKETGQGPYYYAPDGRCLLWDNEGSSSLETTPEASAHMARHDPARVINDLAAKRRILEHAKFAIRLSDEIADDLEDDHQLLGGGNVGRIHGVATGYEAVLAALAAPYAEHPDYDEDWKP